MKPIFFFTISFLLCAGILGADLEVDREELKKGHDVEFVNYTGPYDTVNTFEEILGIGVHLGINFTVNSRRSTYHGRYSIIHVYDPSDTSTKYNADIFVIEKGSFIDHVRNIRTVLAGYLQTAYGYSLDDALLVARFITLYNAVFRGNIDYFKQTYKPKVMENISATDAGLALVYSEWPGKTKVLIPLSEIIEKGKPSALDTQKLTEEEVKDTLRKEPDKAVDDRKKIVELQEKQLEEKEKDLAVDKKKLEEDKKKLEEDRKKLEEEKKKTGETTATVEKEKELAKRQEEIKKQEESISRREEKIKASEDKLKKDRDEIARDERGLTEKTASTTTAVDSLAAEKGLFLKVKDGSENESGSLFLYDFRDKKVDAASANILIKERRLYVYNNLLLVVAEPTGKGASYLMFLDAKTLAVTKQSEEEVYKNAVVTTQGSALFTVIRRGPETYVGKFNSSLTLIQHSQEQVNPATPLVVSGAFLYAQAKNGTILRLSVDDLSTKDTATVP